jgi:hypothetical protein
MIKTFRGKLADDTFDTLRLTTKDGLTGYNIKKFELIPSDPGGSSAEHIVQVYTQEPSSNSNDIDLNNPLVVAVGYCSNATSGDASPTRQSIIIDAVTVNQDLYVSHKIQNGSGDVNYYLEMEQVKLDLNEATVATLKDMRGRE